MKFYGQVGFWVDEQETSVDVWESVIVERDYYGDVLRNNRRFQETMHINDELVVSNQISILSDLYAQQNWSSIRYVVWNGQKWSVSRVEVNYPRITLELGGIYNAEYSDRTEQETS